MAHDLTDADIGKRIRVTVAHEGALSRFDTHEMILDRDDDISVLIKTREAVTVERLRPALPIGLGAVVRLDGPEGSPAVYCPDDDGSDDAMHWQLAGQSAWETSKAVAARIHEVLSPGIDL